MATTPKNTIKNWFKTNLFPTQAQFWAWLDSYRHKDEPIPVTDITGLNALLDLKVDIEDINGALVPSVNSYSELIVYPNPTNNMIIRTLGALEINDGGHGLFILKETAVEKDDGTILDSSVEGKKWFRIYDQKNVNLLWFGAKGNGTFADEWIGFDNTKQFEAALLTGKNIFIPAGTYIVKKDTLTDPLGFTVNSNQNIRGENKQSIIVMDGYTNGDETTYFTVFRVVNKENITISDLKIRGSHFEYIEETTFDYACVGISLFGENVKNVTVKDCIFESILGHGLQDNTELAYNTVSGNVANYCSQNGLNINSKYATIINNYGSYNGFGLIEAGCGNSIITGNVAEYNYNAGITVGGYNAESTNGHGNNNVISGNICNNNVQKGMNISIGVVDSIISNNICYKNGQFGMIVYELYDKISNNTITGNTIFDNGIDGGVGKQGLFVKSKGNTITNNTFYNTEAAFLTSNKQDYGIVIEAEKHGNVITGNHFKRITNYDIYISYGCEDTRVETFAKDKVYITAGVKLVDRKTKTTIAWADYPINLAESFLNADNPSTPKSAILPDASKYPIGQEMFIFDEKGAAATNNITIKPTTGQKINGIVDNNIVINTNYGSLKLLSDGVNNWIIIN